MAVYITGDTHGLVNERLNKIPLEHGDSVIILGDVGLNFYLNKTDEKNKAAVEKTLASHGAHLYCVRGNHEERPQNLTNFNIKTDLNVMGKVYFQKEYPHIHYFLDGEIYTIQGLKTLVVGGAYSIDKERRLMNSTPGHWCGWFAEEQLSNEEFDKIIHDVRGTYFDLVLSHTCPYDWMPQELFLPMVSSVDTNTEKRLQELRDNIGFGVWLFGHFHANMSVEPYTELLYNSIDTLDNIVNRWRAYARSEQQHDNSHR